MKSRVVPFVCGATLVSVCAGVGQVVTLEMKRVKENSVGYEPNFLPFSGALSPVLFETTMTFGSNADTAKLIVTMGTDLTLVTSRLCLTCGDRIYDADNSSTKQAGTYGLTTASVPDTSLAQQLIFTGGTYRDQVCLMGSACVSEFEFFSALTAPNVKQIDGVLGLAPNPTNQRLSFSQYLKSKGQIKRNIVAIKQGADFGNLTFGGPLEELLDSSDQNILEMESLWADLKRIDTGESSSNSNLWGFNLESVKFGQMILSTAPEAAIIHNTSPEVVIRTANATFLDQFDEEMSALIPTLLCKDQNDVKRCYLKHQNCSSVAQGLSDSNLTFVVRGYAKLHIPAANLFLPDPAAAADTCNLLISVALDKTLQIGTGDQVVLGLPLFRTYYTLLDFDNEKFALSGYRRPFRNENPRIPIYAALIVSAVLIVLVAIGLFYLIRKRRQANLKRDLANYEQI